MARYIDCDTKDYAFLTLLRGLYAEVDADGLFGLRVVQATKAEGGVIKCTSKDSFLQLFRQAIDLADDAKPALRICIDDFANGAGLSDANECDSFKSMELLSRLVFVYTTEDEVAVSLLNIT